MPTAYPTDACLLFRVAISRCAFDRPITVIVGENGVGKSTLLEGIAVLAGSRRERRRGQAMRAVDNQPGEEVGGGSLATALKASWLPKDRSGAGSFARSFSRYARYLDDAGH